MCLFFLSSTTSCSHFIADPFLLPNFILRGVPGILETRTMTSSL
ncbi:uncharacterized protein CELE_C05A2.4 [Caenorhabditis elegans]|uniref:Uncharacterized protein n=1 Tax=Caenorhabditis elegans TaxID=6239 RepID=K8F7Y3_CAEEL|nr:Uncharacterized protein CELE_C05A2.4 [Caenorhabditis elegans]CCO25646.1 Uncharacterized protein CELE_C05A2.4 [Caenorhabditis elegans]|eukprot:NP_001263856.1 Uncharacterized protein CELE_C05A2.4 [Caenorhabditis elegans]